VTYSITHTSGAMEHAPGRDSIAALLDELDETDIEHADVSVSHESGWTLSVYPSGRLVWENIEEDDEPLHTFVHERAEVERLLFAVADGHVEIVDAEAWEPGYGS